MSISAYHHSHQQQLPLSFGNQKERITTPQLQDIKFIDLFAGIGGFHLALHSLGAKCVFASEKDVHARQTYSHNFNTQEFEFNDDIRKISPNQIPNHDILCAGFPCQPFSQAGLKKGFDDGEDSERGNLFFCILDIIEAKRPKAFILENVRHLINHDDGKTFEIIQTLLKKAGYRVYYQVLKASDYNIPQHRPRVFIIGFRNADELPPFQFPPKLPLTYTMSDIWGGHCEKEIGFTLRVGGKGSNIDDRRNWEFYRVDGEVKRIGINESKKMMAFPDTYHFPVSKTQAMKQLGNSVCVEVVRRVANEVINYLNINQDFFNEQDDMAIKRNKGELSEIYALCKVIFEQKIYYGDLNAQFSNDYISVLKIHTEQSRIDLNRSEIIIHQNGEQKNIELSQFIRLDELTQIVNDIKNGRSTFSSSVLDDKVDLLGLEKSKGTAYEKGDISLSFDDNGHIFNQQNASIKSFLGGSPTLINASQATNFIYEIENINSEMMEQINAINTRSKIKDRLQKISDLGGSLIFKKCENPIYESTLRKTDSYMPEMLADALLAFFQKQITNRLADYPIQKIVDLEQRDQVHCRLKDFIKASILGIFPTHEWDGNLTANSVLLVNDSGELLFYHTNKDHILKNFFYQNTFFDTPSSSRHRFGLVYQENGKFYFKLNLQLRLAKS
ncbi:HpaII family restriction endonuclease [Moraxella sp. ZJ142]|uniref:HpaII family restriction endonuclease n=1 Tax=Moraxella marmotae TaxID=3344520 RepID=UPI0035D45993